MSAIVGVVRNGVVEWEGSPPPDGTRVEAVLPTASIPEPTGPTHRYLLKYAGKAEGLPADFAEQHDHYIHGTPKR